MKFFPALWLSLVALSLSVSAHHNEKHSIEQRLKPAGSVKVSDTATRANGSASEGIGMSGEQIYGKFCIACHLSGVAGAPKLTKAAWETRIAKGTETLYNNAINGINAMPPKGTCMSCSDDDIKKTIDYMIETANAN